MDAGDLFAVIYTLGAREAGGVQPWEKALGEWADESEEAAKMANFMARRHDPTWRPTADELPNRMTQSAPVPLLGEPAPLKDT